MDEITKNDIDRILDDLDRRREKVLNGGVNCIPSPFPSFKTDFPGIEQGTYYLITGAAKSAKTQITSFLFLYTPVLYAYHHPDQVRLKIFYFPLEETKDKIITRFMSHLLYTMTNQQIRVSPRDLRSVNADKVNDSDKRYTELLRELDFRSILDFFVDHVEFVNQRNPTGLWMTANKYAEKHGKIFKKKEEFNGMEVESFDHYEPNDPDEYVIFIWDHASLTEQERGWNLKQCIDKLSEYCKDLRDNYNYIPVLIQQQNMDTISLDAYKQKKIMPTLAGLADSKNPGKDASLMLGITNPHAFEIDDYRGYDTKELGGYARFFEAVLAREGESNGYLPLYFDGATNFFGPLPKPDEKIKLSHVYQLIKKNMGLVPK